jgi:hypothetical protein
MIALTVSFFSLHRIILEAITGTSPDDILEPAYEKHISIKNKSNSTWVTFIFKTQLEVDQFVEKVKPKKEFAYVVMQRNLSDL